MMLILMKASTKRLFKKLRTLTRGFLRFLRASLVNFVDVVSVIPAAELSIPLASVLFRFMRAFTFSSCGSCSCERGVQISSSNPVHCGRGTSR